MTTIATESSDPQPSVPTYRCARHPNRETLVRCGKCDTPLCPACMVQTPVGVRCKSCANARPIPTYDVNWLMIGRGLLAGLPTALLLGAFIGWVAIGFSFIVAPVYGWIVATAIGKLTNEKRGIRLQVVAGVCIVLGLIVAHSWQYVFGSASLVFALGGISRDPRAILGLVLGSSNFWFQVVLAFVFAWSRLR